MIWIAYFSVVVALLYITHLKLRAELGDLRDDAINAFDFLARRMISTFPNAVIKSKQNVGICWSGAKLLILNAAFRTSPASTIAQLEDTLIYVRSQFNELSKNEKSGILCFEASYLTENGVPRDAILETCLKYGFNGDFSDTMARHGGSIEKIDLRDLVVATALPISTRQPGSRPFINL